MKFLKNKQYAAAVAICVIALALAGWRLVGDAPRAIDLAVFVVFGVALLWLPVIDMAGQILRKLGEQTRTSVNETSMGVSASWPAARTHRQELELALVGVVGDLVHYQPKAAGENVKTMVDAILAEKPVTRPDANVDTGEHSATITLPVVDPGPDALEREIQAKASAGPRVTPAEVEAEVGAEYSFTLDKALVGCPLVDGLDRVTVAVLVLKNGAKLVGVNYGSIDPAQHNAEVGRREARAQAVEQIWPLLGFRLRDELARPVLTEADSLADLNGTPRPAG